MQEAISSIRNLGPAMEAAFLRVGIASAGDLRAMGTDAAYAALLAGGGHRPHFIAYYVIEMGLQGRPWNDCKGEEKTRLRARFDAICAAHAAHKPSDGIEMILDQIGVIPAPLAVPPPKRPRTHAGRKTSERSA